MRKIAENLNGKCAYPGIVQSLYSLTWCLRWNPPTISNHILQMHLYSYNRESKCIVPKMKQCYLRCWCSSAALCSKFISSLFLSHLFNMKFWENYVIYTSLLLFLLLYWLRAHGENVNYARFPIHFLTTYV